jgi:hypothetical protein
MTGTYSGIAGGAVRSAYIPFNNLITYTSPGNPNLAGTPYVLPIRPGNLIDPVAFKMMQYFPSPNVAVGSAAYNPLNNWIGTNGSRSSDHRFDIKVDHRLSEHELVDRALFAIAQQQRGRELFRKYSGPLHAGPERRPLLFGVNQLQQDFFTNFGSKRNLRIRS